MTVLITGAAGFIGYHLCSRLMQEGIDVVGIDNINSYYDKELKRARIAQLKKKEEKATSSFNLIEADICDKETIEEVFKQYKPNKVVNLAAQAGVRYSIENPAAYVHSNLAGFGNILEGCRNHRIKNLIYASSSSVYGGNRALPFSEDQNVDHPLSLYAATKKANELMAHAYSNLYGLPTTGLRFFTVYGPWGRPDMALFIFTKAILAGEKIQIFNNGDMTRDFTYIDDVIESVRILLERPSKPDERFNYHCPNPSKSWAPYNIFNVGNSNPTPLLEYIEAVENEVGIIAIKEFLPMQAGDVQITAAKTTALEEWSGFKPNTPVREGVAKFVSWYRGYYNV